MKFKRCYQLATILMLSSINRIEAQTNIDSFVNTLHNKDVTSVLESVAPEKTFDSLTGKFYSHSIERVLTSIDVSKLRKAYPKYLIVEKLVRLLDDSERDWYADL